MPLGPTHAPGDEPGPPPLRERTLLQPATGEEHEKALARIEELKRERDGYRWMLDDTYEVLEETQSVIFGNLLGEEEYDDGLLQSMGYRCRQSINAICKLLGYEEESGERDS